MPKVKFCLHSASLLLYIAMFASMLCGPAAHAWPWMWQRGHRPAHLDASGSSGEWFELLVWIMTLAQVLAEAEQVLLQGARAYWEDGWNKLDILSLSCMGAAFVIRVVMLLDGGPPSSSLGLSAHAFDDLATTLRGLFVAAIITLILRCLDALSYNKDIGELYTIFLNMLSESSAVYMILLTYAIAFGVAFTALLPQGVTEAELFERPFYLTFWALLGDFDLEQLYAELGSSALLMPMLLFAYTFITTCAARAANHGGGTGGAAEPIGCNGCNGCNRCNGCSGCSGCHGGAAEPTWVGALAVAVLCVCRFIPCGYSRLTAKSSPLLATAASSW